MKNHELIDKSIINEFQILNFKLLHTYISHQFEALFEYTLQTKHL